MKRLTILLLCAIAPMALAQTAITIEVLSIVRDEGTMVVTVYESKKSWLKRGTMQRRVPVDGNGKVTLVIELPPGEYAFHAYQDLDDNGEMKTNFIGIPKEPTAVSNDAKGKFGPPRYEDAKVVVADMPASVSMNLVSID